MNRQSDTKGFAWVFVLMALAMTATVGAYVAQRWSDQISREKETQLLRVGQVYAQALAEYRASSPGTDKHYPDSLEQLLMDSRFVGTRRHLRMLYPDPITGKVDWVLVRDARGDIMGLHSRSASQPWRRTAQRLDVVDLPSAEHYDQWLFTPRQSQ